MPVRMSTLDSMSGNLADGAGAELERLHLEWQQLEQRRNRLSGRRGSSSTSLQSSMLDLQSTSNRSGMNGTSPSPHLNLEEEREALRLALGKGRSGMSGMSAMKKRNAHSPSNKAEDSRQNERDREIERDLRAKVATTEKEIEQLHTQLANYQTQTRDLQKRLENQDRLVSDLTADLQRSEAGAKHNKEL